MNCIRCSKLLDIGCGTKACETCIKYIDKPLVCERCNRTYTRTNRERHYRSYRCRGTMYYELQKQTDLILDLK